MCGWPSQQRTDMNSTPTTQVSFAQAEYEKKKKRTRREVFLEKMQQVVPWSSLMQVIEPHYPKSGKRGRPPIGLERMLRVYFLQQWFGLADEALEDALYDSQSMREFVGLDLSRESAPDATTVLKFRCLLEQHQLTAKLFEGISAHLSERGLLLREGTMVDATIIAAPPSTKNEEHARDPEMHQTKKCNEWHFGMKAHIGADADSGLVHSFHATAANESDVAHAHEVLHGQEKMALLDARLHRRRQTPGGRTGAGRGPDSQRHRMERGQATQHDHQDGPGHAQDAHQSA